MALGERDELGIGYHHLDGLLELGVDRLTAAGAPQRGEGAEDSALHDLRWAGEDDRLAELGGDHGELQRVGHPLGVRAAGAREAEEGAYQVEEALPRIDPHQHGGRRAPRVPLGPLRQHPVAVRLVVAPDFSLSQRLQCDLCPDAFDWSRANSDTGRTRSQHGTPDHLLIPVGE
jgi:hypothetical protein